MVDIDTIEGEWHNLAIDDGDIVLEANEYYAEIDDGTDVYSTKITNISYSPSANKAKNITIDVPQDSVLESNKYLGETLRVYVDTKLLFQGDIMVLETSRTEGEDYRIEAEPPGKRLKGDDIDKTKSNSSVFDAISDVIDGYNDLEAEHSQLRESSDETLSGVTNLGLDVLEGPGSVEYSNITKPETIYYKIYTPGSSSVDVSFGRISKTIDTADGNRYGSWYTIESGRLNSGDYTLSFELNGNARLINWVAFSDHQIKRETVTPDINDSGAETNFYSKNASTLVNQISRVDEGVTVIDEDGNEEIRSRKVSNWAIIEPSADLLYSDDIEDCFKGELNATSSATAGREFILEPGTRTPDLAPIFDNINSEEPLENARLNMRVKTLENVTSEVPEDADFWGGKFIFNEEEQEVNFSSPDLINTNNYQWLTYPLDVIFDSIEDISEFKLWNRFDTGFKVAVDSIVVCHDQENLNYTFDNTLNNNFELESPVEYAHNGLYDSKQYVEFSPESADKNIASSTTNINFSSTSNAVDSWGVEQSLNITPGETYIKEINNTDSVSESFAYPGASHSFRVSLSSLSGGSGTGTPTQGDVEQNLNSVSIDASFNNLDTVSDESLTDNRLSTINTLANDSTAIFRFDGNTVKVFQKGDIKNDVDLYKEAVNSTRDISETYRSCLVKGKNDIFGSRIFADNAPSYVQKDKFIVDREIESTEAANAKARSFLKEHSDIEYSGSITSLPTLAPIGETVDGSKFSHGKDMIIENVRYGKRRTSISFGFTEDIASQLVEATREVHGVQKEGTAKGSTVPVGEDEFSERGGS